MEAEEAGNVKVTEHHGAIKRSHKDVVSDDDNSLNSATDDEGFEVFLSRYSKRLRHQQQQQLSDLQGPAPASLPSPDSLPPRHQRHGPQQSGKPDKAQRQQQQPQYQLKSGKSNSNSSSQRLQRSKLYDDVIDTVIASQPTNTDTNVELHNLVKNLQLQINDLTLKVEFLMSVVGITPPTQPSNNQEPSNASAMSYSSVVAKSIKGPIRDPVLAAVHADLQLKQSRHCNIVVSGLPINSDLTDEQQFTELSYAEFNYTPAIIHTKRLGKKIVNRLQPLLVVLQDEEQAGLLLSFAKLLRNSSDEYTSRSIFISPHQTRAERQAAYEARVRRREQAIARSTRNHHTTNSTSTMQGNRHQPLFRAPAPSRERTHLPLTENATVDIMPQPVEASAAVSSVASSSVPKIQTVASNSASTDSQPVGPVEQSVSVNAASWQPSDHSSSVGGTASGSSRQGTSSQ